MKKFETPKLNISMFKRGNVIALSGEVTPDKTATEKAKEAMSNMTIVNFVTYD